MLLNTLLLNIIITFSRAIVNSEFVRNHKPYIPNIVFTVERRKNAHKGGISLKHYGEGSEERCVILGNYIVQNNATVRSTAKQFGISKSTVHQDITTKLEKANKRLFDEVKAVLDKNKQERHIRGGEATKQKYQALKKKRLAVLQK